MEWLNKKLCILVLIVGILLPNTRTGAEAQAPTIDSKTAQTVGFGYASTPDKLDLWIEKLVDLESQGRADIKVLDVNGRWSMGCLQYQQATWDSYKPLIAQILPPGETITEKTIYNCSVQKRLTKLILSENPKKWTMWYTSVKVKGLGLPPI